ncbi:MAG TPA: carbon monoxide dehydrogenase subunit G [Acidobacteriota bacterium]
MIVTGEYLFPATAETVWRRLMDPDALQRAIPGCRQITAIEEDQYQLEIGVIVGSVKGTFLGNIALRNLNPPVSYEMQVDSAGKAGFVRGIGTIRLQTEGEQTRVLYEGEVQIGGAVASVGQRLIQAVSKKITNNFFESMKENLAQ